MAEANDILVDIPDANLSELAEIYEPHRNRAPHVHSLIKTGIKWKKSEKFCDLIKFMSPNNTWRKNGTIIVLMEYFCYDIFVFTLDSNTDSIYEALLKSSKLNFDQRTLFFSIHKDHVEAIKKFTEVRKLYVASIGHCDSYSLSLEAARRLAPKCPSEVYVKKLEPFVAKKINAIWPHKYPNSEKYIRTLIEANGGFGVFLTSTDELVAWVLKQGMGILDMLQTEVAYKRKGYGKLAVETISRALAEEDIVPFANVVSGNAASRSLFEKIGFEDIGHCLYVETFPDKTTWTAFYKQSCS